MLRSMRPDALRFDSEPLHLVLPTTCDSRARTAPRRLELASAKRLGEARALPLSPVRVIDSASGKANNLLRLCRETRHIADSLIHGHGGTRPYQPGQLNGSARSQELRTGRSGGEKADQRRLGPRGHGRGIGEVNIRVAGVPILAIELERIDGEPGAGGVGLPRVISRGATVINPDRTAGQFSHNPRGVAPLQVNRRHRPNHHRTAERHDRTGPAIDGFR